MTNHQTIIIILHLNSVSIILKLYLEEYKSNSTIRKITYIYIYINSINKKSKTNKNSFY